MKIGEVESLFRYPVKSMCGETLEDVDLGWHGLDGDRRLGLRRIDDRGGFPWLTASKLPELILFAPVRQDAGAASTLPSHVRTPSGAVVGVFTPELAAEVGRRHGSAVEMTHFDRGIFDEASVSVISSATVNEIGVLAGHRPDVRRFRPNILLETSPSRPFHEDDWVGGVLTFGGNFDERCAMINFDPDSARSNPEVLKAVVRERDNKAGVYGTVIRRGPVAVGQPVYFHATGAV